MLESYLVQTFIYIILIGLVHYLYLFFRNNLTNPKVIDLVNRPTTEYTKMYNTIKQTKQTNEMKDELKDYFKNLNKKTETTSIHNLPNPKNIRNQQQTRQSIEKKKVTFDTPSSNHNVSSNNRQQEIPSNNIQLEYSSLNQNSGGISYSTF